MITRVNEQSKSVREYMRGGKKHVELTALSKELPENARLFSKLVLVPGASIGYHVHEKDTELFYILKGTAVYSDAGEEKIVSAGDVTICPTGTGHSIANNSDEVVELIALIVYP